MTPTDERIRVLCGGHGVVASRRRLLAGTAAWLLAVVCLAWVLPAGTASAQTSSATTETNTVVGAGIEVGRSTLTTTYTASQVTATVSPATIRLEAGQRYRAMVCVNGHVLDAAPDAECATRDVDTRAAIGPRRYAVPTVSKTMDRPAGGNSGYATQQVTVWYLNAIGSPSALFANSWPASNLAGASLPLFPVGETSGPLPGQQGVTLETTSAHGGVNSGQPDSMCIAQPLQAATPRPDLSSTALGDLPFYYEVGAPTGTHAGESPTGVVVLFHGGGWATNGGGAVQDLRGDADRWRARGWLTVNSSYRACGRSTADATLLYDRVRATYGAALPVCTFGKSAGGHLALMVATSRPGGVNCVINQAGPTDATSLPTQRAFDPATGGTQTNLPKLVHNLMVSAFGQENLSAVSPALSVDPGLSATRVLAVTALQDSLVPYEQMTLLRDRMQAADPAAYAETMQLAAGAEPFAHATVSQPALDDYYAAERDLVAVFAP